MTISEEERQKDTDRLKRAIMRIAKLSALGILIAAACLQHFVLTLPHQPEKGLPASTDGLVVPTGGQARIHEGLLLLHNSTAQRMLITGVGKTVSKQVLAGRLNLPADQLATFDCCVDIEKTAMDTKGNAIAARNWANLKQFSTIRLVTSNYHLPRAHLEFARLLPERKITGWPVVPPDLQLGSWYLHWPAIRLLVKEYAKYLLARLWI